MKLLYIVLAVLFLQLQSLSAFESLQNFEFRRPIERVSSVLKVVEVKFAIILPCGILDFIKPNMSAEEFNQSQIFCKRRVENLILKQINRICKHSRSPLASEFFSATTLTPDSTIVLGFSNSKIDAASLSTDHLIATATNSAEANDFVSRTGGPGTDIENTVKELKALHDAQLYGEEPIFDTREVQETISDFESDYYRDRSIPIRFLRLFNVEDRLGEPADLKLYRCDLKRKPAGVNLLEMIISTPEIDDGFVSPAVSL